MATGPGNSKKCSPSRPQNLTSVTEPLPYRLYCPYKHRCRGDAATYQKWAQFDTWTAPKNGKVQANTIAKWKQLAADIPPIRLLMPGFRLGRCCCVCFRAIAKQISAKQFNFLKQHFWKNLVLHFSAALSQLWPRPLTRKIPFGLPQDLSLDLCQLGFRLTSYASLWSIVAKTRKLKKKKERKKDPSNCRKG